MGRRALGGLICLAPAGVIGLGGGVPVLIVLPGLAGRSREELAMSIALLVPLPALPGDRRFR